MSNLTKFSDLSLRPEIMRALETLGFTTPTEIQGKAIPVLLGAQAKDFHGQAQTGTGKTLAFGIPLVQTINPSLKQTQALIVAPTRELVVQICQSLRQVAQYMGISIEAVYGGAGMQEQVFALRKGVHIVVGTPGRLNDHLRRGTLSLANLKTLVLDEADIMLDMGFKEEMDDILEHAPAERQIWLFSATVKPGISDIMRTHMRNTVSIRAGQQQTGSANTKQYFAVVGNRDKLTALSRFIDAAPTFYGFIFCQTKLLTAQIAEQLMQSGYKANALHGDMSQAQRNRVIAQFKNREFTILVCTDVAARGIDVADVTHVVNYSLPEDQESYVHRIGRTGRAGKEGIAISFVTSSQVRYIKTLERKFKVEIKPINVPSFEEIAQLRVQSALDHLLAIATPANDNSYCVKKLNVEVAGYSQNQLMHAVVSLLNEKFCKEMKDQANVTFAKAEKINMDDFDAQQSDVAEVTIFLGLDDGVTQEALVDFLAAESPLSPQDYARVRVIKRRSFIKVAPDQAEKLINAIKGKMLCDQRVRAAISVDHGFEPRMGGSRERSGGSRNGGSFRRDMKPRRGAGRRH